MHLQCALALGFLASVCLGQTTHYDATRIYSHTRNIGMQLGLGNVGDPGTRGFKDPAQYLNNHLRAESQQPGVTGAIVAQSNPSNDIDGWTIVTDMNLPSKVQPSTDGTGLIGSDTGGEKWYFLAPADRFSGDLAAAYNGQLSMVLVHSETPSNGFMQRLPDIVLEATCGHSMQLFDVAGSSGAISVALSEGAGWIDSRTKRPPSVMDFLGVLSNVAAVKVRGGYFRGRETTSLSAIVITGGKAWYPCCTIDGTVDICAQQPSSYYSPPNLKFYCEGHMYRPVHVKRILPRFSRRTGGATITIIGENFGLAGSQPVVRINNRPCKRTYFAPQVKRNEYSSGAATGTPGAFGLTGTGDILIEAHNPAGNALVNAYNSATDSMKQQYPEHCWNGMQDDGTDKGYNYGTTTSPKYLDQGETGIDTGGPCFSEHCSSCPVPTLASVAGTNKGTGGAGFHCSAANQIVAVSSGACKGRGNDAAACPFNFPYLKFPDLCPENAPFTSALKVAYSGPSGSAYVARDAFQQYRWNMEGIYASVDKQHGMVEGRTVITHPNPAPDSTLITASFSTEVTTIEVRDAVALCGFEVVAIGFTGGNEVTTTAINKASTTFTLSTDPTAAGYYFNTFTPSASAPAYVLIDNEIIMITLVTTTTFTIGQRGAFGTGISDHAVTALVRAVEICRNAAVSIVPAAATGKNSLIVAIPNNAICQSYTQGTAKDGRYCTLQVSNINQLLNTLQVGDVVRRVSTGRTTVAQTTALATNGPTLVVQSAAALFGTSAVGVISCGSDTNILVTGVALNTNTLTLTTATVDNVGSTCTSGAVVTVVSAGWTKVQASASQVTSATTSLLVDSAISLFGTATITAGVIICGGARLTVTTMNVVTNTLTITAPATYFSSTATLSTCLPGSVVTLAGDATPGNVIATTGMLSAPVGQQYFTTFDVLSTLELSSSDVAEFSNYRYLKIDDEIVRVTNLADANSDVVQGNERISVARAQLGTAATSHSRGATVTLLPRMTEIVAAVATTDTKLYFASAYDILSNNIGINTPGSGLQTGGTTKIVYLKIDDEIMKVTLVTTSSTEASVSVLRAKAGTLATAHAAGSTVYVLACLDGDESGNNCGGSCKPCPSAARGGPAQQDKLICITPPGDSGPGPSGQGSGDLPVTVEASPGPTQSPFQVRMSADQTTLLDQSSMALSCISEQNRGFQYGAHDFVWGVHFQSANQGEEVQIADMGVDRNTGETYVVGTMQGTLSIKGKHIAMSNVMPGVLSVALATSSLITGTAQGYTTTTITLAALATGTTADYIGKNVKITSSTKGNTNCMATVSSYTGGTGLTAPAGTNIATTSAFARVNDGVNCDMSSTETAGYSIYNGKASYIAKFSKDGRPVWLNKIDTTASGQEAVITSVAVDPTGETGGAPAFYVAGYYSDALPGTAAASNTVVNIYSVDPTTRVASSTITTTLSTLNVDSYGKVSTQLLEGRLYQEGFLIKYSGQGKYMSSEVIKGTTAYQQLQVSNLIVRVFHAATSATINTQMPSDQPAPTMVTQKTRVDVEYDRGMAVSAAKGGGTELRSSIVLAITAATYTMAGGQSPSAVGSAMDKWYNGLTITITCGKGIGQSRTIQDYVASTRTAYVQPHWDGNGEMTPDSTSCYVISGKPSSDIVGRHLVDGGIYVSGKAVGISAGSTLCFGQMPDVYQDSNAPGVGIPICSQFSAFASEEQNFLSQYDKNLRAVWVRFAYDGAVIPTGATTVAAANSLANGGTSLVVTNALALLGVSSPLTLTCGTGTGTVTKIDLLGGKVAFSSATIAFSGTSCTSSLGVTITPGAAPTTTLLDIAGGGMTLTKAESVSLFFFSYASAVLPSTIVISCGDDSNMQLSAINVLSNTLTLVGASVDQLTSASVCTAPAGSAGASVWLVSGSTSASNSGMITAMTAMEDLIYITGTFGYAASGSDLVSMRLQNCTFDSDTVSEGPPANTQPVVVSLKKLCRIQNIQLTNIGNFPMQSANSLLGGPQAQRGYAATSGSDYTILNTVPTNYVQIPFAPLGSSTKQTMYVAAYDGSGALVWYHYVEPVGSMTGTNDAFWLDPTAMTSVQPALGGQPLVGIWKEISDTEIQYSLSQPQDATAAKDISSERVDSATVRGGYVYVTGSIKTTTINNLADFGITKYPLECSYGKDIGTKGADISSIANAPCAGQLQSQQSTAGGIVSYDVFVVKYAAKGAVRQDSSMLSYSTWRAVGTTGAATTTSFYLNPLDSATANRYKNTVVYIRDTGNSISPLQATISANSAPSTATTDGGQVTFSTPAGTVTPTHYTFAYVPTYGSGVQPEVQFIRRTGVKDVDENAKAVQVHDLTGAVFVSGNYKASVSTKYQGSDIGEQQYLASQGNDGSYVYTATRASSTSANSGDDHFGLQSAGRVNALGCPMQRYAPNDENEERRGLTGNPDCTLYSHAPSTSSATGFVVKFNENGDQTRRGNKNRRFVPSITGYIVGTGTISSTIAPCSAAGADGTGTTHVLTGTSACSTSPQGCSCLVLAVQSVDSTGTVLADSGTGQASSWSGMKIKITKGKGAGYQGIISAYIRASGVYNVIPALPVQPDESSIFQLNPWSELSPKIHKANCDATLDYGCNAYGVEWAKTIGLPIGQTKTTVGAYSSPSEQLNVDRGTWKGIGSTGVSTAQGFYLDPSDSTSNLNEYIGAVVYISASTLPPYQPFEVAVVTGYTVSAATTDGGKLGIFCPGNPNAACNTIAAKYRLAGVSAYPYKDAGSGSTPTSLVLSSTDSAGAANGYLNQYALILPTVGAVKVALITASIAGSATIQCKDQAASTVACPTPDKYAIFSSTLVATTGTCSATQLILNPKDSAPANTYKNAFVYLFAAGAIQLAQITSFAAPSPAVTTAQTEGGTATIACTVDLSGSATCITATSYAFAMSGTAITAVGTRSDASKGLYQQSFPIAMAIVDSDIYIAGTFKGFDRYRFGIESVDESVGYRSVGDNTAESYMVKLMD